MKSCIWMPGMFRSMPLGRLADPITIRRHFQLFFALPLGEVFKRIMADFSRAGLRLRGYNVTGHNQSGKLSMRSLPAMPCCRSTRNIIEPVPANELRRTPLRLCLDSDHSL